MDVLNEPKQQELTQGELEKLYGKRVDVIIQELSDDMAGGEIEFDQGEKDSLFYKSIKGGIFTLAKGHYKMPDSDPETFDSSYVTEKLGTQYSYETLPVLAMRGMYVLSTPNSN